MIEMWPCAETKSGRLFSSSPVETLKDVTDCFDRWERNYGEKITKAWVEVYEEDRKIVADFRKEWVQYVR